MRLLLKRRYSPRHTLGRLYLGSRLLCQTLEPAKACFSSEKQCVEEGIYELEPIHSEEEGWSVQIGGESKIVCLGSDFLPKNKELCPVTSFRSDGKPTFTRLAFLKLLDELGALWERGEVVELQVVGLGIPYRLSSCQIPKFS